MLEWKIPNQADWQSFVAMLLAKWDKIYVRIIEEFGPNGILVVGLFGFFLCLIFIIYIKSVLDTLHGFVDAKDSDSEEEYIYETDEETAAKIEAEKELSMHLVTASETSDDFLGINDDYERLKKTMQAYAQTQKDDFQTWQNSAKTKILSDARIHIMETISVIIKMLARQVSEPKIAQVLAWRLLQQKDEEYILQTVRSIRDFIGLANAGMFAELPGAQTLPQPAEALEILCNKGDNTLCLELLQKLTSQYVDDAMPEQGVARQVLLAQAANYACLTGNFAALDDMELAMTSYNFATEISPESVNAWSRLGDAYFAKGNEVKAMFAYQSVMELADKYMYSQQIANAKKHLAPYYLRQGMEEKSHDFQTDAAQYYESYGLHVPLTTLEDAAADHIISRQEIHESLEILLPQVY